MKTIVVLNDGTDEIFNLHTFQVRSREQVYMEWGDVFLTSGSVLGIFEREGYKYQGCRDEAIREAIYHGLFTWLVDKDAEGRCFFLVTDEPFEEVEKKVNRNNDESEYGYREEDFSFSWEEVKKEFSWN